MTSRFRGSLYPACVQINKQLSQQRPCYAFPGKEALEFSGVPGPRSRQLRIPKIGIYAGTGTSHSWLWFVDLFEDTGFHDLEFLDETGVQAGLDALDVLVISGGDTFAVAGALGPDGAESIRRFVRRGGLYIGSCAGAYLPMRSSKAPLDLFNFVDVKITNLSKILPEAIRDSFKFCTSYGCDFIFHPVREEVVLKTVNGAPPFCRTDFTAPLYGGPGMTVADPSWVVASYGGFTGKTSFLVAEDLAGKILLGNAAVVRVPWGEGVFYLLGPHLEHPKFPLANRFVADVILWETAAAGEEAPQEPGMAGASQGTGAVAEREHKAFVMDLRREISNSRIVAVNLEFLPLRWMIGKKVYEPEKARVYLESMWKRLASLEKAPELRASSRTMDRARDASAAVTVGLRRIKQAVDDHQDSLDEAVDVFDRLHHLSTAFFTIYFETLAQSGGDPPSLEEPVHQ